MDETSKEIRRSDLCEPQKQLGAVFGPYHGWEMAQFYSSAAREHLAVRANGGLVDTSYRGAIKIYGSEAIQFINGLVTNNVKSLEIGKGMRAAFLTGHGKVKALCRVLNLGDSYLI